MRFSFAAESLQHIGTDGLDQRVKIVLPLPHTGFGNFGLLDEGNGINDWYSRWRMLPDEDRNVVRTYTARNPRPAQRELDIDFVLHGDSGPASRWALTAAVGDELVIVGPDSRSGERSGIEFDAGSARRVLLVGDETALPAIAAILETLPPGMGGAAFIEVPYSDDVIPLPSDSAVELTWLARDGAPHGEKLSAAVRDWTTVNLAEHSGTEPEAVDIDGGILWEVPTSDAEGSHDLYAWLAGEAGVITSLRRHLVRDVGLDRRQVAFMGYWRRGRAES